MPLVAAAHITGGGLVENPPRVLPETLAMELDLGGVKPSPVFAAIAAQGVAHKEMLRTFNCGVGMLLVVAKERADEVSAALAAAGQANLRVGGVVARTGHDRVHLSNVPV
jgi:phosphoribosylformylglycinamidine cyclo-ligase